ncbi:MAG: PDZ domain-containing protein [Planctomycetaceae bacterium]
MIRIPTMLGILPLLAAAAAAQSEAIVGVQARATLVREFQGRAMQLPVNLRQVGICIGEEGLVLTAAFGGETEFVRVFLPGSTEPLDAEVVESDETFTILRVEGLDLEPTSFDTAWVPRPGEALTWIGLLPGASGQWTVVRKAATVDAVLKDAQGGATDLYSDPPFHGPVAVRCALVLNAEGRPAGVAVARAEEEEGGGGGGRGMRAQGAGLPVVRPASAIAHLLGGSAGKNGVLGVSVETLAPKIAEALGLGGLQGVLVTQVTPGSAAEKAGIQPQDVVVKIDGLPIPAPAALKAALRGKAPGTSVHVELVRTGDVGPKTLEIDATLGESEQDAVKERHRAERLGFTAEPLTAALRRAQNLGAEVQGVAVRRVLPGGPASRARPTPLRRGDLILKVGETAVPDLAALKAALETLALGKPATLFVRNGAETRFVEITPE